jgi:(1->4)-alpha-D-glucan 1-alpha-D-glucosylmutase
MSSLTSTHLFPESTYRLQFHAGFTFRDATRIVPYLRALGITHVYASPYLKARPGSTHGYDIVDHRVLNPEIGTLEDHDAFVAALHEHGMGLILDIVPNHMGVATNENPWWDDVLENGPSSRFAEYFDIAWKTAARPELQDKVLLPVLGETCGDVLESGQLKLTFDGGGFALHYYERRFPVAPRTYSLVLSLRTEELERRLGADSGDWAEYQSILTAIGHLPDRTDTEPAKVTERQREKEVIKRRLAELAARNDTVRGFIEENVAIFNGTPGDPHSFDLLDELLTHQCYRLAYWRVASDEINYRRFFDVNDLAALAMEREEVFNATHDLIFKLLDEGKLDGLRIDHPDGLYDPRQYLQRLQDRRPVPVWVEKILGAGETLPADWPVTGTTGYEFVNAINGLFVDKSAELSFTRLYREQVEDYTRFAEVVYRCKRLIVVTSLASELNMLAQQLDRLAQKRRQSRDFTLNGLRAALREVIACFPVYRSYISDSGASQIDREHVETAVHRAALRNPLMSSSLFRFVRDMVLLVSPEGASDADKAEQRQFAGKFQQVTSPVMAKGLEDTAFYRYNRLVSLNEVGGNPGQFGITAETLHKFNADRQAHYPRGLAPLSTHDTKRSEDVRARINVLSEMPDEWRDAVKRWTEFNAPHRVQVGSATAPDANEEYLIYQTLIGAWPPGTDRASEEFTERIAAYLVKALREAKVNSSWVNPHAAYDGAVQDFIRHILDSERSQAFLNDFLPLQKKVARCGAFNTLSQTLLKITAPGVADTYQGTEVPDFSLVDPDNRRPVDYRKRQAMLNDLRGAANSGDRAAFVRGLTDSVEDGRAKLFLTWRALSARREHPGLFAEGEYIPLAVEGAKAEHVFAFARRLNGVTAVVVVPRLLARLNPDHARAPVGDVWGDTHVALGELAPGAGWRDLFTERSLPANDGLLAADLFAHFPVALLFRDS